MSHRREEFVDVAVPIVRALSTASTHQLVRVILIASLLGGPVAAAPTGPDTPAKALVEGVPFISWHEMRDAAYPGSNVVNPSFTAANQMMLAYWGADYVALSRKTEADPDWRKDWVFETGSTLADLKTAVGGGWPVVVTLAATPDAHRFYFLAKLLAATKKIQYSQPKPVSGSLGEMISIQAIDELRRGFRASQGSERTSGEATLNDSLFLAARLVIGYDDEREIFIVHDPSLGPNLEIAYADFERMAHVLSSDKPLFLAYRPKATQALPLGRVDAVRARIADDEAAVALFQAYGRSVLGRYSEAEEILRTALAREGLSPGRRHLLNLELAVALNETGRNQEAIAALKQASADFDGYHLTQRILATLLRRCGSRDEVREAKRIERTLDSLCSAASQRRVADELGHDFPVMGCKGELLGWYRP